MEAIQAAGAQVIANTGHDDMIVRISHLPATPPTIHHHIQNLTLQPTTSTMQFSTITAGG